MNTIFDGVVTPLKIDISTGDAITPKEVRYSFKLMLEDRSIDIWAYNLETVLAEKLETIITRATTNTRMRIYYDIYILEQLSPGHAEIQKFYMMRCWQLPISGAQNGILTRLKKFLLKWKTIRLCRNFGRHIVRSFLMRLIWNGV